MDIKKIVDAQREYFKTDVTKDFAFRLNALKRLKKAVYENEQKINDALKDDLNKSEFETYMTETGIVLSELTFAIRHLKGWMRTKRVRTPLSLFHSRSFVISEPYGVALIMSPWNYPFMLLIDPLIGAIAAGNCAVLKPSNYSPATSQVIHDIISENFEPEYISVVMGGRQENKDLLDQRFDYIFFTGSTAVGRFAMEKASVNLTPVTLELGGKSPCIVDKTANLELAAKRIVFGKYLNAGQTCNAVDYLLVHKSVKDELVKYLIENVEKQYGKDAISNKDFTRIINEKHFERIMNLIKDEEIILGGKSDAVKLKIAPTILDNVSPDSPIMQEEIFGPVLPVLTFETLDEVENFVVSREKPLALYLFTTDKKVEKRILKNLSFGGGCVNDTIIQIATPRMGFGGVGHSGMGAYHGKLSFDTFSHHKSMIKKYNWIDPPFRYQPVTKSKMKWLRRFLK
ncbi:MAG: aldehyde dehydrogenase [Clostridia bacterium]|jgi:aldehyde dehydrogenase (NAD+)